MFSACRVENRCEDGTERQRTLNSAANDMSGEVVLSKSLNCTGSPQIPASVLNCPGSKHGGLSLQDGLGPGVPRTLSRVFVAVSAD